MTSCLRRLLLAFPWFGLAAFIISEHIRFLSVVDAARADGQFVCPMTALDVGLCLPAAVVGVAALFGNRWIVVLLGIPTAGWVALWLLGGMLA